MAFPVCCPSSFPSSAVRDTESLKYNTRAQTEHGLILLGAYYVYLKTITLDDLRSFLFLNRHPCPCYDSGTDGQAVYAVHLLCLCALWDRAVPNCNKVHNIQTDLPDKAYSWSDNLITRLSDLNYKMCKVRRL